MSNIRESDCPAVDGAVRSVLHITEAFGGGVTAAISEYVRSTPEYSHSLLYSPRSAHDPGDFDPSVFHSVLRAEPGPLGLLRSLLVESPRASVVHLHSSWAGLVGRAVLRKHSSIVYTPHCFSFERTRGRARLLNPLVIGIERLLSARTTVAACVSPREASLARRLGMRAVTVPNLAVALPSVQKKPEPVPTTPTVVTVGRLEHQKDPRFFAAVVDAHRRLGRPARYCWLGDGAPRYRRVLEAAGVEVTGWLPRSEVMGALLAADVYVHTAAWEGAPVTLLEAQSIGLPCVVRSIPATTSLGWSAGLTTPDAVADELSTVLSGRSKRSAAPRLPSRDDQAKSLRLAYDLAVGPGPERTRR